MKYDVILIDGSHLLHRSISSYGELGFHAGGVWTFTGGLYGFLRISLATWKKYAHERSVLIVCWEGGNTYRTGIDPNYKANRRSTSPEASDGRLRFRSQESLIREMISTAGWSQAYAPGYEADDALATLAKKFEAEGKTVVIYSGDQDMHQCVSERVHVISGSKGEDTVWTPEKVEEKWGLPPGRVVEAKALMGDPGDNIPGIEGLGISWAAKILEGWEQIQKSYVLSKVVTDCEMAESKETGDRESLRKLLESYQINSMTTESGIDSILAIGY